MSARTDKATQLDESATQLDAVADKLNEDAERLHQVAGQLHERAQRSTAASARLKHAAQTRLEQARSMAREHPLGGIAALAAAAAFIEVEIGLGILAGLGATALIATRNGPATRDRMLAGGRQAYERARAALAQRRTTGARKPAGASADSAS
jgi:hypothetical protein